MLNEHVMPDHITDGPQTPEDVRVFEQVDEDDAYERSRQDEIDDKLQPK